VDRPRTRLRFIAGKVFEWTSERFDRFNDSNPAKRFRMRLRKCHEVRPRQNSSSDPDWESSGTDPQKDNVTNTFDFEDSTVAEVEPIVDLGQLDLYENTGNGSVEASGFRRAFQTSIRFGPNRLSRIIISAIVTNIKNAANDSQVTVAGGMSFNIQLDNFPYRSNDTSAVLEFDIDTDSDEGSLEESSNVERDDEGGLNLADESEGSIKYNDTRRIRWKRRVYCDGNKEVIIKTRLVRSMTENPDGGFTVRKKN
jgi:hypothetical protein